MVVRIRLARFGCKNQSFYRVMAADSRSPRDGKHLEVLGYYNPLPGITPYPSLSVSFSFSCLGSGEAMVESCMVVGVRGVWVCLSNS
ncbi:hypothetical protein NL676_033529 [Syzygium grande]|nr:hypothetical protein NL676_033529 [Syzygium grande]